MKNNESNPKAAEEAKVRNPGNKAVLIVPECDAAQELLAFNDTLIEVLAEAPAVVTMRFVGVHQMCSDSALLIVETMKGKSPKTTIVTEAWSSLIEGSVLTWLTGDIRRIRSTAWLFFRHPQSAKRQEPKLPWENEGWPNQEPVFNLRERDNQMVLKLINRYLPVKDLAGSQITPHILSEYCLLEGQCPGEPDGMEAAASGTVAQPGEKSGEKKTVPRLGTTRVGTGQGPEVGQGSDQ